MSTNFLFRLNLLSKFKSIGERRSKKSPSLLLKNKSLGDSENSCEVLVFCPRDVSIRRGPPGLPTGPQYVEEDELKVHRG